MNSTPFSYWQARRLFWCRAADENAASKRAVDGHLVTKGNQSLAIDTTPVEDASWQNPLSALYRFKP
jgi:hypothetical protein